MLAAVFALIDVCWFSTYVLLVERFGRWLRRSAVKARIEPVTGLALVTSAARLASSNH